MKIFPENLPQALDFDLIKKSIASHAQNAEARDSLYRLYPLSAEKEIRDELHKTDEILSVFQAGDHFPNLQLESVKGFIRRLETRGVIVEEREFRDIFSLCLLYEQVYEFLKKNQAKFPLLYRHLQENVPLPQLMRDIDSRIDERSQVRSSASPRLSALRSDLHKKRLAADRIFERVLKKYREKGIISDIDESVSKDRRVLAVQASFRGQVNGIFHGSSSRHSISFIEPAETVEINNEIALLQDEEKQEVRRILRELSELIRPHVGAVWLSENHLIYLDFCRAKAQYARRENAVLPRIGDQAEIKLREAYNPALKITNRQREKAVVPLNLHLYGEQRILVISGPNAGGKSIALKTLGLLQIMLQSGIPVPVHPDSQFYLFKQIMGDIGDSQSIENELSTYSSKLMKMRHFLQYADADTLLLIDEFGSGSDPELGSALAQVFMEELNRQKVLGIFTTHYNAIKALAAQTPGVVNASMLFDRRNFEPEYLLEIGTPGSSYTFEVAANSGIPRSLIEKAQGRSSQNTLEVDRLLVEIQDQKVQLEKKHERINRELQGIKKLESEKSATIEKLEEKLQKQSKLNEESDRLLYWGQKFQKLVESWMDQKSQKDKKAVVARFIGMLNQRSSETEVEEKKQLSRAGKRRQQQIVQLLGENISVGEKVKMLDNGMEGIVQEIKGDKYRIILGDALSMTVDRKKIIPASARLESKARPKKRKKSFKKPPKDNTGDKKA